MYIKQVSRRGPSRPPCPVRPGPGWVGLARPALPCPTPAPTGSSVSGRAAEPGPGPQQEARWLVADPKAFAWFAAVPRGGRPSLLRGSVPGPATEQVRRVGWRVSFLPLFPRLVSFIAGVKWRWGEALLEPGLVRGLWGPFGRGSPGVPALQAAGDPRPRGLYPGGARTQTKGSPQLSGGIFQLLKLWVFLFFYFFFFFNLYVVLVRKCDCIWGFN